MTSFLTATTDSPPKGGETADDEISGRRNIPTPLLARRAFTKRYAPQPMNEGLYTLLLGTLDDHSSLAILRGKSDVLRLIWHVVCEEYWSLHIDPYCPKLYRYRGVNMVHSSERVKPLPPPLVRPNDFIPTLVNAANSMEREWQEPRVPDQVYSGVPMAIIAEKMEFPPRIASFEDFLQKVSSCPNAAPAVNSAGTSSDGDSTLDAHLRCWNREKRGLEINMMPIDLYRLEETLPTYLHGYLPMLKKCRFSMSHPSDCMEEWDSSYEKLPWLAFVTIDERYVDEGCSQRRRGLHVEAPTVLASTSLLPPLATISPIENMPGQEERELTYRSTTFGHHVAPVNMYWGGGPIRASCIYGGIFCCSNRGGTTAVYNCQVVDTITGEQVVIGRHGSVEHCRNLIENISTCKLLDAGELVWFTDRTPHESLPIPISERDDRHDNTRQFFRLVAGPVSAWFADHSTANPTGFEIPATAKVSIIHGSKYSDVQTIEGLSTEARLTTVLPTSAWKYAHQPTAELLKQANEFLQFREFLYHFELGQLIDVLRDQGIWNLTDFAEMDFKATSEGWAKLYTISEYKYSYDLTKEVPDMMKLEEFEMLKFAQELLRQGDYVNAIKQAGFISRSTKRKPTEIWSYCSLS